MTTTTTTLTASVSSSEMELMKSLSFNSLEFIEAYDATIGCPAVYMYTQHYYQLLNPSLRKGLVPQMAEMMDKELEGIQPTEGWVYRGQSLRSFKSCLFEIGGKVFFQDKAYLSTSNSEDVAKDFGHWKDGVEQTVLHLYCTNYSVSKFSEYPEEEEMIVPRNTLFEVIEKLDCNGPTTFILVEVC